MLCGPSSASSPASPSRRFVSFRRTSAAASGNKVGVYPGYVCAIAASIVLGRPVKWIESRAENLTTTAFARDYWMTGELAATRDGIIKALRVNVTADHGAFDACADPDKMACRNVPCLHRLVRHSERIRFR